MQKSRLSWGIEVVEWIFRCAVLNISLCGNSEAMKHSFNAGIILSFAQWSFPRPWIAFCRESQCFPFVKHDWLPRFETEELWEEVGFRWKVQVWESSLLNPIALQNGLDFCELIEGDHRNVRCGFNYGQDWNQTNWFKSNYNIILIKKHAIMKVQQCTDTKSHMDR